MSTGGGLIYIDPNTIRRNAAVATTTTNQDSTITMATTACQLARAFGIVVRLLTDLLNILPNYASNAPNLPINLTITTQQEQQLQVTKYLCLSLSLSVSVFLYLSLSILLFPYFTC